MTPDFSCERCQDSLPWYVANSLSNDERAAMERHIASCEHCRVALGEWREVAAATRRADERIPLDTASTITWADISRQLAQQTKRTNKANERTTMRLHDRSIPDADTPDDVSPDIRPHKRGHTFAGVVAAVALIALSVGVFSLFTTHGTSRSSQGAMTAHPACVPSQATASLPAHTMLSAIAPVGTDDGWAVGGISDPEKPELPPSALMLHLRNCHWALAGTPIPNASLSDISMVSADEGWAVGVTYAQYTTTLSDGTSQTAWDYGQPLVLHYIHGSWQKVQVSANPKTTAEKVKMVSANEGWMLLYDGKHPTTINGTDVLTYGYSLRHYQNGTWTNVPMDALKPTMAVSDLDARQPGEVWIVGEDIFGANNSQPAFVAHYSGGTWTSYTGTAIRDDLSRGDLRTISEVSPNDVWVGGTGLYHFDGTRWSKASIQGAIPGNVMPAIGQVAMLSSTQGWAFPSIGDMFNYKLAQEPALRYDHGVWQWATLQVRGAPSVMPIFGFAPSSATQGWALGLHVLPDGKAQETTLLYYDGGAWGVVPEHQ